MHCGIDSVFFRHEDSKALERSNLGKRSIRCDEPIQAGMDPAAKRGGEMKRIQRAKTMPRSVIRKQPAGRFVVLSKHWLHHKITECGAHRDLTKKYSGAFGGQVACSLFDAGDRNQFQQGKLADKDQTLRFPENSIDPCTSGLRVIELGERARIEKIAQALSVASRANDLFGERARHTAKQFLRFLKDGDSVPSRDLGAALGSVLMVDFIVESFQRNGYPLVFGEREWLDGTEDALLIDGFNARRHSSSLSDFPEGVGRR